MPRPLHKTPTAPPNGTDEEAIRAQIPKLAKKLGLKQDKLYAERKRGLLIVLQGLDASGKDNTVKHVFAEVNPAGCQVKGFKAPTEEELGHDFLWRIHQHCPERGMIQIFNRSHYEDVLVPVVEHGLKGKAIKARYEAINAFERSLIAEGTDIYKFMLHVSPQEQQARFEERREDPAKRYKYREEDLEVFAIRDKYLAQYDHIFKHCSEAAPWHIIPADKKWWKNYLILEELAG